MIKRCGICVHFKATDIDPIYEVIKGHCIKDIDKDEIKELKHDWGICECFVPMKRSARVKDTELVTNSKEGIDGR